MKIFKISILSFIIAILFPAMVIAETVGVFFSSSVEQIKFAAGDVKTALESKGFKVEMLPLTALDTKNANKKVVIALTSNVDIAKLLDREGVTIPSGLGEQAYSLQTTNKPQKSYWVIGCDANGAMYGGLQIAENITFNNFSGVYNLQESPSIIKRGIKLNYPFDERCPTYGKDDDGTFEGESSKKAIQNIWDFSYWTEWFDQMARYRYNVVSLWSCHPFTCMVNMEKYPDVAIQDVKGFDGFFKKMSIDDKIAFWKKVMSYAHDRGFELYLVNWNIFTYGATDKYGITSEIDNSVTKTYMYECMKSLMETYPDLDGFVITAGERMAYNKHEINEQWLWDTYGKAVYDYAILNPNRKFRFIHRFHYAKLADIKNKFQLLTTLPNVDFNMSFKYSQAHMYAATNPKWWNDTQIKDLTSSGLKTFFTIRNDDFYYHNWGNPDFARAFINGIPGKGTYLEGFYMGSDGISPTRNFFSKNNISQEMLEVKRQWYMFMLLGRLAYNPTISDNVFKMQISQRYPEVSSTQLFEAWKKASAGIPKVSELIGGSLYFDYQWWPEACQMGTSKIKSNTSFVTIDKFIASKVVPGSVLCSIDSSALTKCQGKKSSYMLADEIEADALVALKMVEKMQYEANTELGLAVCNIRVLSYLSVYYAYKIRGATFKIAEKSAEATKALGQAYCWWMQYTNLMDSMYEGMTMQRSDDFSNWHHHDANVLKEFHDNGGIGIPSCK